MNCKHCGKERTGDIPRSSGNPSWVCADCKHRYLKEWREKNKDRYKVYYLNVKESGWFEKNRSRRNARSVELRKLNPEKYRERDRRKYKTSLAVKRVVKWRKSHLETFKAIDHAYRARKRNASGRFSEKDVKFLFDSQKGLCVVCEVKLKKGYCVDHIKPLALNGTNDKYNLQLLCRSCNAKKSKKDPILFMQQNGRLL